MYIPKHKSQNLNLKGVSLNSEVSFSQISCYSNIKSLNCPE